MDLDEIIAALAEQYGKDLTLADVATFLQEKGINAESLDDEDLQEIVEAVNDLEAVDAMADADAAQNPFSLDKVDAMADADAAQNPFSIDKVDTMADADATKKAAKSMANEDNTPVKVKKTDKDKDGDTDTVSISKKKPKDDTKSEESEDDNADKDEDKPHDTKLNGTVISALDRKY